MPLIALLLNPDLWDEQFYFYNLVKYNIKKLNSILQIVGTFPGLFGPLCLISEKGPVVLYISTPVQKELTVHVCAGKC